MQQGEAFTTTSQTDQVLDATLRWENSGDMSQRHTIADTLRALREGARGITQAERRSHWPLIGDWAGEHTRRGAADNVPCYRSFVDLDDIQLLPEGGKDLREIRMRTENEWRSLMDGLRTHTFTPQSALGDRTIQAITRLSDLSEELSGLDVCEGVLDSYEAFIAASREAVDIHAAWATGRVSHRSARKRYRRPLEALMSSLQFDVDPRSAREFVSFTTQARLGYHALLAARNDNSAYDDPLKRAFAQAFKEVGTDPLSEVKATTERIGHHVGSLLGQAALSALTLQHSLDDGSTTLTLRARRSPVL